MTEKDFVDFSESVPKKKVVADNEFGDYSASPPKKNVTERSYFNFSMSRSVNRSTKNLTANSSQSAMEGIEKPQLQPQSESSWLVRSAELFHRLVVFAIAVWYVEISLYSFSTAIQVLQGSVSHDLPMQIFNTQLMAGYAGTTTIQESPLVQEVLDGKASIRNDSMYLVTPWVHSYVGCTGVEKFNDEIYSNEFMRFIFSRLQMYASYNLSYIQELELVVPVVDCTFDYLVSGDQTVARIYYLTRQKDDPTTLKLLSTSLSAQDYLLGDQFQKGSATLAMIAAIDDMTATNLTHEVAIALNYPYVAEPVFEYADLDGYDGDNYWKLSILSNLQSQDPAKNVRVARRFGRYLNDPTAQSNIETAHWDMPSDAVTELSEWRWHGRAVLHDSWAWTHGIQGIFALNVMVNLGVLAFVVYRRMRVGHMWVGDAFSTISGMLLYRGVLVVIWTLLNGFWTITKMCISIGDTITNQHVVFYKPELVHADLLAVYLNVVAVLCYLVRERVDPVIAFGTFELGWNYRIQLAGLIPALKQHIEDYAFDDSRLGLLNDSPALAALSPMKLLTAYGLEASRKPVISAMVISIYSPMVLVFAYIIARKMLRYINFTDNNEVRFGRRRSSDYYRKEGPQSGHTSFEIATGSALSKRFGIISGYDNYIVRKDYRLVTIDAVYGNGFLVAGNGKFLVAAQDLLPIVLMKVTRIRFTNIFVYEIMKDHVKETARLVYPTTVSWADLWHLDVSMLS